MDNDEGTDNHHIQYESQVILNWNSFHVTLGTKKTQQQQQKKKKKLIN